MPKQTALAITAHPDDIEFMMAGTLLLLGQAGFELHMLNIANGCCGSATEPAEVIAARRWEEAQDAARTVGAVAHPPLVDDLTIEYSQGQLRRLAAIVREVAPTILLLHSPQDYMEDHMNACRLTVTAAFTRGMPNFETVPPTPPVNNEVTLYHALPYGLRDGLRRKIIPGQYVDITSVLPQKRAALACHRSQKEWLDVSQGLDSYLQTMEDMSAEVGAMARARRARLPDAFAFAEGWRRHAHLGFCGPDADPLADALAAHHFAVNGQ
jgi:LmbE family N-acetylglucosaminyl deacetylase